MPIALLDANVLVPQRLSSLLPTLAEHDLFQPRWSAEILDEAEQALINRLGVDPTRARRRLNAMRQAFPRADADPGLKGRRRIAAAVAVNLEAGDRQQHSRAGQAHHPGGELRRRQRQPRG